MDFQEWWDSNDDPSAPYIGAYGLAKAAFLAGMEAERTKYFEIFGQQVLSGYKTEKEVRDECKRSSEEFFKCA